VDKYFKPFLAQSRVAISARQSGAHCWRVYRTFTHALSSFLNGKRSAMCAHSELPGRNSFEIGGFAAAIRDGGRVTDYSYVFEREMTPEDLKRAKSGFWSKMRAFIGRIPFAPQVVALYYLVRDPKSDLGLKGTAVLALLYFISPVDAVPDVIPLVGLMDDAAVISLALMALGGVIKPYMQQAQDWYDRGAPLVDEPEVIKDAVIVKGP
jgi:uncharacterized membrane protein YkvA (DUF1232 family)